MKKNFFTFMDTPEFKQNWFDLGHTNSGSCNMGQLVPVLVEPTLPGDYFNCNISYLLRMAQMVAPPMTRIGTSFFAFYCPNRILMNPLEWDKFLSDVDGTKGVSLPILNWSRLQTYLYKSLLSLFSDPSSYDYSDFVEFINADVDFISSVSKLFPDSVSVKFLVYYSPSSFVGIRLELLNQEGDYVIHNFLPSDFLKVIDFGVYGRQTWDQMLTYLFSKFLGSSPFVGTVLDYVGFPVNSPALSYQSLLTLDFDSEFSFLYFNIQEQDIDFTIQVLPLIAYLYIWNEYFRQEFIQEEIPEQIFTDFNGWNDDLNDSLPLLWTMKRRDWEHDYFTSALPSPQLGESSSIEIGADGKFTIPELREANVIQRIREKMLHGGQRIWEILSNFFNERVSDSRIQKPEFIRPSSGGFSWLRISDIYQTAPGTSDSFPTLDPSAGIAAPRGASANANNNGLSFKFKCDEHGYIIVLMNIQPEAVYSQGLPKHFTYLDTLDYGWPDFANLTEQPVYDFEIYATPDSMDLINGAYTVFGYQPQYSAYKFHNSELHGELRDDLDFFHFGRLFSSAPRLNSSFLECNPSDRPFPISYEYDKITYHLAIDLRVNRRLPYFGIPSLR